MKVKARIKTFWNGNGKYYALLFGITLLLLHTYFYGIFSYPEGDDTTFHLANIAAIESTMDFSQLQFLPGPILPSIAGNFGYGIGLFYPRIPHYTAAFLTHVLGTSPAIGLKITHIAVLFLSGVMIFHLTHKIWKNKNVSLFSAIFYMTSSYMISDIIIRDAFAECFQFLFLPMILIGLYELFYGKRRNFYLYFVIGYLGMIHTHLVMSVYLTLVPVIFLLVHLKETVTWKNLKALAIAAVFILLVSLPSVIPMLEHKALGGYAVFEENIISSTGLVQASALNPLSYLLARFDNKHIESFILLPVIICLILGIRHHKTIFRGKEKLWKSFLAILIVFFLLSSKFVPWQYAPQMLAMIQFPWRLELAVVLMIAILSSSYFVIYKLSDKKRNLLIIITFLCALLPTFPLKNFLTNSEIENLSVSERGTGWSREYLPMEVWKKWENEETITDVPKILIMSGEGEIVSEKNEMKQYQISVKSDNPMTLEIPRLYYLGYHITWTGEGKTEVLEYQKSKNGLIQVEVPETGSIRITYRGTKIDQAATRVAVITGVSGIVLFLWIYRKE